MKKMIFMMVVLLLGSVAFGAFTNPIANVDWTSTEALEEGGKLNLWGDEVEALVIAYVVNTGTGSTFYVDSGETTGTEDGLTWATAVDTLDEAFALCTANRGDYVFVAQGHVETMGTASVNCDIAGVTIIGLGNADLRPTFTFDTATDTFDVAATGDNVTIAGLIFKSSVTVVVAGVDVIAGAVGVQFIGCDWVVDSAGTDEFEDCLLFGAACDRPVVSGCLFDMGPSSNGDSDSAIHFVDSDNIVIVKNKFFGDYSVAPIENITTASNFITIADNYLYNGIIGGNGGLNTTPCITLFATTSGVIINNQTFTNVATADLAIVAADCFLIGNSYNETDGGVDAPPNWLTTDTVMNIFGVDDADNQFASTNVVANIDGTMIERNEALLVAGGTTFNHPNYLTVSTSTFDTTGTWSTVAAHEIAVVTGSVRMQIMIEVVASITTTGNNGTIALGFAGNVDEILTATDVEGGAGALETGDVVTAVYGGTITGSLGGAEAQSALTHVIFDVVVIGGLDVGYTVATGALTAGDLLFHIWWAPITTGATVTAGAGGPF